MAKTITKTEKERLLRDRDIANKAMQEARTRLVAAKAEGDISENAEYDTAINEIEQYSHVIEDIDAKIMSATVIPSRVFIVIMDSSDGDAGKAFKVELGSVDTLSFDINTIRDQNITKIKNFDPIEIANLPESVMTVHSKLGSHLDKLSNTAAGSWHTFSYIDNRQTKRTFTVSLISAGEE